MAETQTYGHSDIIRYLHQKMSVQEMHAFEKAMMDDPFLADAIEGYSKSDAEITTKHLSAIEAEISGEKQKAKIVPLGAKRNTWWRVAAILIVIVIGGALTYSLLHNNIKNEDKPIAQQRVTAEATEAPVKKDSIGPAERPLANVEPLKELLPVERASKSSPIIVQERKEPLVSLAPTPGLAVTESEVQEDKYAAASAPTTNTTAYRHDETNMDQAKQMQLPASPLIEFKGKVLDKSGEPLPFASIRAIKSNIATVADAKGNFTLKAADSTLPVNVAATGYATASTEIKSNKTENKIILQDNEMSLSEVVVTQLSKNSQKKASARSDNPTAEPVGGWKNFEQYLNRQIDSLKTREDLSLLNSEVVLEFLVDDEGSPVNIKPIDKTNPAVAEKAKKIISNGPKWKNKNKEKKVKVTIPF